MNAIFNFFLIVLVYLAQSSELSKKYETYAHQLFNQENTIVMQNTLGIQYVFEATLKLPNFVIYQYQEPVVISESAPRKYVVTHDRPTQGTFYPWKDSKIITSYPEGTVLEIIQITHMHIDGRIRGQVKDTLDWVSIKNMDSGYFWMKPVTPPKMIEFKVITCTDAKKIKDKQLSIEFLKLNALVNDESGANDENLNLFFQMFGEIYTHSPFDTKLKLKDSYKFPSHHDSNIINSNLKFTSFFKTGKTFFEQFNFQYIVEVPLEFRSLMYYKLDFGELKTIRAKYSKIGFPTNIYELVKDLELNYPNNEVESIFIDIFYPYFGEKFFHNFPIEMIYRPMLVEEGGMQNSFKKDIARKQSFLSKLISFSKPTTEKPDTEENNYF